ASLDAKRALIEPDNPELSLRRQCELLDLPRATYYYQPAGESALNLHLMRLIDAQYTQTPFYGWPKMTAWLRQQGYAVNHKRVQRLMHLMGLQAIYPKPKTSVAGQSHKLYPYLLRDVEITRPNFVWSADITYLPLQHGFMYLDVLCPPMAAREARHRMCRHRLVQSLCARLAVVQHTRQPVLPRGAGSVAISRLP